MLTTRSFHRSVQVSDAALVAVCWAEGWPELLAALAAALPPEPSSDLRPPKALVTAVLRRTVSLVTASTGTSCP